MKPQVASVPFELKGRSVYVAGPSWHGRQRVGATNITSLCRRFPADCDTSYSSTWEGGELVIVRGPERTGWAIAPFPLSGVFAGSPFPFHDLQPYPIFRSIFGHDNRRAATQTSDAILTENVRRRACLRLRVGHFIPTAPQDPLDTPKIRLDKNANKPGFPPLSENSSCDNAQYGRRPTTSFLNQLDDYATLAQRKGCTIISLPWRGWRRNNAPWCGNCLPRPVGFNH